MIVREVKQYVIYAPPNTKTEDFNEHFKYKNMEVIAVNENVTMFFDPTMEKHGYIPYLLLVISY